MGGICYGAKFNSNFQVIHSQSHSLIECKDFQGSKYVQSDIRNCFKEIHDLLSKEGIQILFTGTPCQVAAIKQYVSTHMTSPINNLVLRTLING